MTTPEPTPDLSAVPRDSGELAIHIQTWLDTQTDRGGVPNREALALGLGEHLGSTVVGPLAIALELATTPQSTPAMADATALRQQVVTALAAADAEALAVSVHEYDQCELDENRQRLQPDHVMRAVVGPLLGARDAFAVEVGQLRAALEGCQSHLALTVQAVAHLDRPQAPSDGTARIAAQLDALLAERDALAARVERLRRDLEIGEDVAAKAKEHLGTAAPVSADTTTLRGQIARAIAEADGRYVGLEPLADATYEQMADVALSVVGPLLAERDTERERGDRLERALRSAQQGLIRVETQRDDLRAAVARAAGVDPGDTNVDTDYEQSARTLGAERERGDRLHTEAVRAIGALEAVRRERDALAAEVKRLREDAVPGAGTPLVRAGRHNPFTVYLTSAVDDAAGTFFATAHTAEGRDAIVAAMNGAASLEAGLTTQRVLNEALQQPMADQDTEALLEQVRESVEHELRQQRIQADPRPLLEMLEPPLRAWATQPVPDLRDLLRTLKRTVAEASATGGLDPEFAPLLTTDGDPETATPRLEVVGLAVLAVVAAERWGQTARGSRRWQWGAHVRHQNGKILFTRESDTGRAEAARWLVALTSSGSLLGELVVRPVTRGAWEPAPAQDEQAD